MGSVLGNPPVFHTLVQININEIPNFIDIIDSIHKDFYQLGFIEKRKEEIEELQFIAHINETKVKKMTSWHFINFEQDAGFVINPNFILFHTTNYLGFEHLMSQILLGVSIINKHLDLVIIERVGLRYLNAVIIQDNERISDYLSKDLLSAQDKLGLDNSGFIIQHAMSEKILVNIESKENCISRVVSANLANSNPLLPQELVPLVQHLKFKDKFRNINGLMTLLDLDSSKVELRMKAANTIELSAILDKLHFNLSQIFESLVILRAFK